MVMPDSRDGAAIKILRLFSFALVIAEKATLCEKFWCKQPRVTGEGQRSHGGLVTPHPTRAGKSKATLSRPFWEVTAGESLTPAQERMLAIRQRIRERNERNA